MRLDETLPKRVVGPTYETSLCPSQLLGILNRVLETVQILDRCVEL